MSSPQANQHISLKSLRFNWALLALLSSLLLAGFYAFLLQTQSVESPVRWAQLAALSLAYQLASLWQQLPQNHRPNEAQLLSGFGPGTRVSFIRLFAISSLFGFLGQPLPHGSYDWLPWMPFFLYLSANMSDFVDGYFARINNWVTRLGQTLDTDLDARALLVVTLLAFQYGKVPAWFLLVALARYLFIFGLWWRHRHNKPVFDLEPSVARRAFAGVQMGFSTAMLVPIFHPPETYIAASLFMLPFLGNFLADWWQVSGRVELRARWDAAQVALRNYMTMTGGLLLRLAMAFTIFLRLQSGQLTPTLTIIESLAIGALAFGILGRITSIVVLVEVGFRQQYTLLGPLDWLLLSGCTALLFWGTGSYSLWQPEGNWYQRRLGEGKAK
jgi:CDP-diacylglycerol--glycerol-3-phosphate 3-phosphatidyltransferase